MDIKTVVGVCIVVGAVALMLFLAFRPRKASSSSGVGVGGGTDSPERPARGPEEMK